MALVASIFCIFLLLHSIESLIIDGTGATGGSPMMKQWGFSYSLLKPTVTTLFTPTSGAKAFNILEQTCRGNFQTDYVVSDIDWKGSLDNETYDVSDIIVVPFFAAAMVMAYNFPTLDPEDNNPRLVLSRENLYQIWSENLTLWNDPRLTHDNPNLELPAETIRLVIREDASGFTESLTAFLEKMDKEKGYPFEHAPTHTQPNRTAFVSAVNWRRNFTNVNKTKSSFQMASAVLTIDWSLGYMAHAYADQAGLSYARVTNNETGKTIEPTDSNVAVSVETAVTDRTEITEITNKMLADIEGPASYPFTTLYYLAYHANVEVDCEQRREVLKFLNWILTSDAADQQINGTIGYTGFSYENRKKVRDILSTTNCGGKLNLRIEHNESAATAIRQMAMSLSSILLTVVILIGITLGLKRNNKITKAAGLAFAACFLLGCGLNYIAVIVFALVPSHNAICEARYVLVATGYTLLLGSMFAKCWEVRKIFARAHSGDISPFQELPWWKFCIVFFSVISVNLVFLLGLGAADPPRTKVTVVDPLELTAIHVCTVNNLSLWAGLEFSYFGLLGLWGGYLAYKTREIWDKYNYPNESRSILLSIYNLVFCLSILVPLTSVLEGQTEVVFFFVATAIIFPTTFSLFSVYGPKMLIFLSSSFKATGGEEGKVPTKMSKQATSGLSAKPQGDSGLKAVREAERYTEELSPRKAHEFRAEEKGALVIVEEDHVETPDETARILSGGSVESSSRALLAKYKELESPPLSSSPGNLTPLDRSLRPLAQTVEMISLPFTPPETSTHAPDSDTEERVVRPRTSRSRGVEGKEAEKQEKGD